MQEPYMRPTKTSNGVVMVDFKSNVANLHPEIELSRFYARLINSRTSLEELPFPFEVIHEIAESPYHHAENWYNWFLPSEQFFGQFYMDGDASKEGYLSKQKQTLRQRTRVEVDGVELLLGLNEEAGPKIILDIPCGYGRHSIELAARGHRVMGIDLNETHLQKAVDASKERGQNTFVPKTGRVVFVQANMINFIEQTAPIPPWGSLQEMTTGVFDCVINMFYSFGFFKTDEENEHALRSIYTSLKPGGKFLMHTDVNMSRVYSGMYKFQEERKLESGASLWIYDSYDPVSKRIWGTWNIDGYVRAYTVRVYTSEEFCDLCRKVGFTEFEIYADWKKTPYSETSEDMIIIAKK